MVNGFKPRAMLVRCRVPLTDLSEASHLLRFIRGLGVAIVADWTIMKFAGRPILLCLPQMLMMLVLLNSTAGRSLSIMQRPLGQCGWRRMYCLISSLDRFLPC